MGDKVWREEPWPLSLLSQMILSNPSQHCGHPAGGVDRLPTETGSCLMPLWKINATDIIPGIKNKEAYGDLKKKKMLNTKMTASILVESFTFSVEG